MQIFQSILSLIAALWPYLILIVLLSVVKNSMPRIRGWLGERAVARQMQKLDPTDYHVFNDVTVQVGGRTSQIDHVVVSRFGIFVIETKNYSGWILGSERDERWTQVIYKRKSRFQNPVYQNYGHLKALEAVLPETDQINMFSIIVFSGRAELKVQTTTPVIYVHQIVGFIKDRQKEYISPENVINIVRTIENARQSGWKTHREHVDGVKRKLAESDKKVQANICPRCGNDLVERKGKRGAFFGCTSYPRCRYIAMKE